MSSTLLLSSHTPVSHNHTHIHNNDYDYKQNSSPRSMLVNSSRQMSGRSKLLMASKMRHGYQKQNAINSDDVDHNSGASVYTDIVPHITYDGMKIPTCMSKYCDSTDLIPLEGYITCRACGLCQAPVIDSQDEKRYHEEQPGGPSNTAHRANSSTVGCSVISEIVPNTVLGTSIGNSYSSNSKGGKRGNAKYLRTIRNDAKYKQFSSKDSATLKKLGHISNICKSANINKRTIEEIQWTFHKLSNIQTNKRRKHQALMATATIIGCRNCGVDKDMNEIATKFDLDIRILRRMVKHYDMLWAEIEEEERRKEEDATRKSKDDYQEELERNHIVHIKPENTHTHEILSTQIDGCVSGEDSDTNAIQESAIQESINKNDNLHLLKYLRKLPIPECYHGIIFNINDWINTSNILAQHIPISRYASVIYLSGQLFKLDISKTQIVAICGISEVTIKKCYSKLGNIEDTMRQILTQ